MNLTVALFVFAPWVSYAMFGYGAPMGMGMGYGGMGIGGMGYGGMGYGGMGMGYGGMGYGGYGSGYGYNSVGGMNYGVGGNGVGAYPSNYSAVTQVPTTVQRLTDGPLSTGAELPYGQRNYSPNGLDNYTRSIPKTGEKNEVRVGQQTIVNPNAVSNKSTPARTNTRTDGPNETGATLTR